MPKQPHKDEEEAFLGEISLELPRHDNLGPVLVTLTNDFQCEECGEATASIAFDLGEAAMCTIYELTPKSLMMLAFVLTKFANHLEGKEV